jgi:selenium-binding protein 1
VTRTWQRTLINILGIVIATGLLLDVKVAFADKAEKTMLVWAGDQAHKAPDFIAVVDFDRNSPKYGKVLRTIPLTGRSAAGNEPHHVGISRDGRTLALGGLLSILKGQDQVFFFDVSDPRQPRFISSDSPPDASITDDFFALGNGGFLVTFMGGPNGAEPGRVVEYDAGLKRIASWPATPPADGFNPHGIAVDEAHNLMVTSDFICPLMTLHDHDMVNLRGTVRVWDLASRSITRTIEVNPNEGAGMMDVQLIPRDVRQRAYTAGMTDNKLYLIDTQKGTAAAVFDFNIPRFQVGSTMISPQLMRINKTGTRLFITLNYGGAAGKVVMFDIARPDHPKVMDVVDLGPNSGPHYLRLTKDDKQIVVTDYFLVEDLMPGGVVQIDGDRKIHVINVHGNRLELDTKFDLDFKRDIGTGPARPHGVVLLPDQDD